MAQTSLLVLGLADLSVSAIQLSIHQIEPRTFLRDIALSFQFLHLFSWFGAMLSASSSFSAEFVFSIFATYFIACIADGISIAIRLWDQSKSPSALIELGISFAWIIIDIAAVILLWLIGTLLKAKNKEHEQRNWLQAVKQRLLPLLYILEMIFTTLMFLLFAAGINRSTLYSRILIFEVPHTFVWLLHRAVVGSPTANDGIDDPRWIRFGILISFILSIFGIIALTLRIYYEATADDQPAILLTQLPLIAGWIQLTLGSALLIISLLQLMSLCTFLNMSR